MAKTSRRPQAGQSADTQVSHTRQTDGAEFRANGGEYDRDRISARAYELYMARGGGDGSDMEDWLAAERECRGTSRTAEQTDSDATNR